MTKKKILLLSDDMRMHSGIATQSKELVLGTAHKYDWVQIGAAINHPENGKIIDMSEAIKNENGISLYCSTRKILSMVRFIPRSSKDEIPDIVSASVDE